MKNYSSKSLYTDIYFKDRYCNNPLRLKQFQLDKKYILSNFVSGNICDVGCGTGEFYKISNLNAKIYGMEINDTAKLHAKKIIDFNKNIYSEIGYFDLVVFRGSIQHVDKPFSMMQAAHRSLKQGGKIIFLATPNSNSILYRIKQNLPMLDSRLNFYIPGKNDLCNALNNIGFNILNVELPYFNTPYRRLVYDHVLFIRNIFSNKFYKHAFWGSIMNITAIKN